MVDHHNIEQEDINVGRCRSILPRLHVDAHVTAGFYIRWNVRSLSTKHWLWVRLNFQRSLLAFNHRNEQLLIIELLILQAVCLDDYGARLRGAPFQH